VLLNLQALSKKKTGEKRHDQEKNNLKREFFRPTENDIQVFHTTQN